MKVLRFHNMPSACGTDGSGPNDPWTPPVPSGAVVRDGTAAVEGDMDGLACDRSGAERFSPRYRLGAFPCVVPAPEYRPPEHDRRLRIA
ncbi:MAG: hypothetical protein ACREXR_23425, partial [Gammaproteobacteria bacterium]